MMKKIYDSSYQYNQLPPKLIKKVRDIIHVTIQAPYNTVEAVAAIILGLTQGCFHTKKTEYQIKQQKERENKLLTQKTQGKVGAAKRLAKKEFLKEMEEAKEKDAQLLKNLLTTEFQVRKVNERRKNKKKRKSGKKRRGNLLQLKTCSFTLFNYSF